MLLSLSAALFSQLVGDASQLVGRVGVGPTMLLHLSAALVRTRRRAHVFRTEKSLSTPSAAMLLSLHPTKNTKILSGGIKNTNRSLFLDFTLFEATHITPTKKWLVLLC